MSIAKTQLIKSAIIMLLIVLCFGALVILAPIANASTRVFYMITTNNKLDVELQFIAVSYDLVVDNGANLTVAQLDRLHALNPRIKIIKYFNGTNVTFGGAHYAWIDSNKPHWFLLDANGKRVHSKSNNYGLKPGHPDVRNWLAQVCSEILTSKPYDGIYLDIIRASMNYAYYDSTTDNWIIPVNPNTNLEYTYLEWQAHQQGKLDVVKAHIGEKLLIFNNQSYTRYFAGDGGEGYRFWDSRVDGAMIEGFIRWANDPILTFRSEANWRKDVDIVADSTLKGKYILAQTGFDINMQTPIADKKRVGTYAFASFLLGKNGSSAYFSTRDVDTIETGHPHETAFENIWLTDIGEPLDSYSKSSNVYQRDFTNGKVLVNPNATQTFTVDLGKTYKTLEGQVITKATMVPHTGLILLNYEAPSIGGGGGGGGSGDQPEQNNANPVAINDGKAYANSQSVTVKFNLTAQPIAVSLSNDGTVWSAPIQYSHTVNWSLAPGDGKKVVHAKIQYSPLIWSDPTSASIILDTTPPTANIAVNAPVSSLTWIIGSYSYKDVVVQASDESGIAKVEFYLDGSLVATNLEAPYSYRWLFDTLKTGSHTFKALAYDKAGNVAQATSNVTVGQSKYKDLPEGHWALPYINKLSQKGIVSGFVDGNFRPAENVTRAEFAKMIVIAMGWNLPETPAGTFRDVPVGHWASWYIEAAKSYGALDGYKDGSFRPGRNISRAEMAKIIAASKGFTSPSQNTFRDITDHWAKEHILACTKEGVISGYVDGTFRPQASATRAEAAKMIAAMLE